MSAIPETEHFALTEALRYIIDNGSLLVALHQRGYGKATWVLHCAAIWVGSDDGTPNVINHHLYLSIAVGDFVAWLRLNPQLASELSSNPTTPD